MDFHIIRYEIGWKFHIIRHTLAMDFHIFPDSFREILYYVDYQSFMVKMKVCGHPANQKNRKKIEKKRKIV